MDDDTKDPKDITAPPGPTHEAGAPPSSPEPDAEDVAEGEDKLGRAGAGHGPGWAPALRPAPQVHAAVAP